MVTVWLSRDGWCYELWEKEPQWVPPGKWRDILGREHERTGRFVGGGKCWPILWHMNDMKIFGVELKVGEKREISIEETKQEKRCD